MACAFFRIGHVRPMFFLASSSHPCERKERYMLTANCTPTRLMSVVEASEFFGMSKYSLRKGIKTGAIPFVQVSKKYFICADKFLETIQSGDQKQ